MRCGPPSTDVATVKKGSLKSTEGKQSGDPISEAMSDANPAPDPVTKSNEGSGLQEGRSPLDFQSAEQTDTTRCLVAVSQMGSLQEDARPGWESNQHTNERDDSTLGAPLQDAGKRRGHHSVSCSSKQDQADTGCSLEIGAGYEGSSPPHSTDLPGPQQRVATDPGQVETSSPAAVQDGRRTSQDHKEEVDRHKWCKALSTIHLVNDDAQCFVNAVYLTVMWTHLMCCDFTLGSWGLVTTTFLATLLDGIGSPLCLRSHPRLQAGFAQWQRLRGEGQNMQQDYSEFLHYFLGWVSSKHVAQTISRRFSRSDAIITEAKSDVHDPILLHHDLWKDLGNTPRFQHVIDNWHHTNGMIQALDLASHIVCFQICRFLDTSTSDRTAFHLGELKMYLPCFTDARLSVARIPYQIAALVHYSGNSRGGHYNCAVAILDKFGDTKWLFHDDNATCAVVYVA